MVGIEDDSGSARELDYGETWSCRCTRSNSIKQKRLTRVIDGLYRGPVTLLARTLELFRGKSRLCEFLMLIAGEVPLDNDFLL